MNNPYTAPLSHVVEAPPEIQALDNYFYIVSKRKFYSLFFATLGSYMVYWSYKNWRLLKDHAGVPCWPVPRGLFLIFFIHGLMKKVSERAQLINYKLPFDLNGQATLVVVIMIISHILDRLAAKNIGFPVVDLISIGILLPMGILLWRMQNVINGVSGDVAGETNDKFTTGNIIWMIIGVIFWGLVLLGLFQGSTPDAG